MDAVINFFKEFSSMVPAIKVMDIVDILVVAFLIYKVIMMVRSTSAARIAKSVLIILILAGVTQLLNMYLLNYILDKILEIGLVALIVVFQPELRRMLVKNLTAAGYTVDGVPDGAEALAYLDAAAYDAAVLAQNMDGFALCRRIRSLADCPILFLTAKTEEADVLTGLGLGGDDYLIKPFALDELLARLRVLTRKKGSGSTNVYTLADLTVDTAARTAKRGGRTLELSAREYALLEYLIRSKGVVLSRQQIEDNLWSLDYAGGTNVVDVYISYLRKKLELPGERKLLHTVRGMGWVLKEDA